MFQGNACSDRQGERTHYGTQLFHNPGFNSPAPFKYPDLYSYLNIHMFIDMFLHKNFSFYYPWFVRIGDFQKGITVINAVRFCDVHKT